MTPLDAFGRDLASLIAVVWAACAWWRHSHPQPRRYVRLTPEPRLVSVLAAPYDWQEANDVQD